MKLSPNTPSPLIESEKNKINLADKIQKNIYNYGDEEKYKITAHFTNEENSYKENKYLKRPYTPNIARHKKIFNPPLTSDNKNTDKYKFNYNFEVKIMEVLYQKKRIKLIK
jgi:hypothetical protein